MKHIQLTENAKHSYKIGLDEIVGLKGALIDVMKPIQAMIKSKVYWDNVDLDTVEYKRRDGFIPHAHNCGGIELSLVVPKCENYEFGFVDFGECDYGDDPEFADSCGPNGSGCECDDDGFLSAFVRIRIKFEGLDNNRLNFYIFVEGGNNDAPYFRDVPTIYEGEFTSKSVAGIKRAASKHVNKILKLIK